MPQIMHTAVEVAEWLKARVSGQLRVDSRLIGHGDGFIAWPGAVTDGRRFVPAALQAGATAVLVEQEGVDAYGFDDDRVLAVPSLKALAGPVASAFFGEPSHGLDVVAFTGTNGKTSSAWWMGQLLTAVGKPCAVVGTLGIGRPPLAGEAGHLLVPTGLTTPDPVLLQARMRAMLDDGITACAMEASSIGLEEGRLNATRIRVAVLTNFTQDHLDFHETMSAYWQAKAALFAWPGLEAVVLNIDDPKGVELMATLANHPGIDLWPVSIGQAAARLSAQQVAATHAGQTFELVERDRSGTVVATASVQLPLIGQYNTSNLLGVLATGRALGVPLPQLLQALDRLTPVPGRMERVGHADNEPLVLVDYAHTPDALEKALQALRPVAERRGGALWALAGCGGDRDPGKRPLMAAVAEREADRVVLTSDNPRSEDPRSILAQMQEGLSDVAGAHVDVDRAQAITFAIQSADARDVVLVAGKGHEDYQEIRGSVSRSRMWPRCMLHCRHAVTPRR